MNKIFAALTFILLSFYSDTSFAQISTLDTTFGTGGKVTTAIDSDSYICSMALQADGKIVVLGNHALDFYGFGQLGPTNPMTGYPNNHVYLLARYTTNGNLDSSFGMNGIVRSVQTSDCYARGLAIQPDGKIVVGGGHLTDSIVSILRFQPNGNLDSSFGTNGIVNNALLPGKGNFTGFAFGLQADGKILASKNFSTVRFKTDGSLDSTFGFNGLVAINISNQQQSLSIEVEANGKILIAGNGFSGSYGGYFIAIRLLSNGSWDNTFGSGGVSSALVTNDDGIIATHSFPSGKILIAGNVRATLVKTDSTGVPLSAFGSSGVAISWWASSNISGLGSVTNAMALKPAGDIVLAGEEYDTIDKFTIRLIDTLGNNSDSVYTYFYNGYQAGAAAVAIQADGKIIAAGYTNSSTHAQFALARYSSSVAATSNAGPDQIVPCAILPGGSVVTAATGTGVWTARVGNPGTATITVSSNPTTTIVNFTTPGIYGFIWTTSAGTDTMLVIVTSKPNAGPDRNVGIYHSLTMATIGTGTWSAMSGNPGPTTIATPTSPTTVISGFTVVATYRFIWTSSGGCSDTMNVIAIPFGNAGMDQINYCTPIPGASVQLGASANGTGVWTAASGNPGTATITTPALPNTTITNFSADGVYQFIWTDADGPDTALVTLYGRQYSGPAQTLSCVTLPGGSVTMAATGTGTWRQPPNPVGSATITSPNSATTTVTNFTQAGTYYFVWQNMSDPYSCGDTTSVTVTTCISSAGPDQTICATDTAATTAATGIGVWAVLPGNPAFSQFFFTNQAVTHIEFPSAVPGTYYYTWTPVSGPVDTLIITKSSLCLSDSVWPGDADHNGIADNNDLLPIGTGYGLNGFTRPDQSIVWSAHYAQDWGLQFLNGTNAKHADCNGDAIINAHDTTAIMQNFGLTHNKTRGYPGPWRTGIPGIKLQFSKDTVAVGDTLITSLILGDSTTTVTNIYGLAFTFHYDPLVVDTASTSFAFINSFIGNSTDKISIHKDFRTDGTVLAAVTGINHLGRNGYGMIAYHRSIITTDNINGKDLAYYANLAYISDITAVDKDGNPIALNAGIDSNDVAYTPTGIHDVTGASHLSIYPNPAANQVTISATTSIGEIIITDMLGQTALTSSASNKKFETIDISALPSGVYTIHVSTTRGSDTARLIITR